jgi:gliding motility-associated lipoprotein GldH
MFSLLGGMFISSCDSKRVFEENKDLKNTNWYIDSVQTFSFKIEEVNKPYNVVLNLRNSSSYPYYNLFLRYYLTDSTKRELKSQQLELLLMDPITGEPTGGGLGDICSHGFPLLKKYSFPHPGTYTIRLKQYMRQDPLPNIHSVGIRLENFVVSETK